MYYVGIPAGSNYLEHYGRLGMKWGQHIFGDDPRWGRNGRGNASTPGESSAKPKNGVEKTAPMSMKQAMLEVNREGWEDWDNARANGRSRNCVSCIMAYDLRRKGYKVKATTGEYLSLMNSFRDLYGITPMSKEFQDRCKPVTCYNYSPVRRPITSRDMRQIASRLDKNAYGIINITRPGMPGHVMNWETVDGKLNFVDAQIGRTLSENEFLFYYGKYNIDFTTTSGLSVDETNMLKWVEKNDR